MPQNWTGKWQGGRTLLDRKGKPGWVLERMVGGARFTRRLEVNSEKDALAELALFDRNPGAYVTAREQAREAQTDALVVGSQTIGLVMGHLKKLERHPDYVDAVMRYLAQWGEDLAGADLRQTRIETLKVILAKYDTARQKRIAALKTFTAYFRLEVNTLPASEDPTLALTSPKAPPEKLKREKGYSIPLIERVYACISDWEKERTLPDRFGRSHPRGAVVAKRRDGWGDPQGMRDVLVLRAKFGMHQSEIDRLSSRKGIIKVLHGQGEIAGTIRFSHKSGKDHTVSLDAQGLAAAQRLQAHGGPISKSFIRTALRHAEKKAGLREHFNPGELRHSFITIAREAGREVKPKLGGVSLEAISAVVGHHGTATTRAHYLGDHIPAMIVVPLSLVHPDDPKATLLKAVASSS